MLYAFAVYKSIFVKVTIELIQFENGLATFFLLRLQFYKLNFRFFDEINE